MLLLRRLSLIAAVAVPAVACASRTTATGPLPTMTCPRGTTEIDERDSDVGWAETEHLVGCTRDGQLEGWAREDLSGTRTVLVGRYAQGRRVGTWTQYETRTARAIGTFTLDAEGTGIERAQDLDGRVLRGAVVRGRRDGVWTFADRDRTVVATDTWSNGRYIGRTGRAPWDPPMVDPADLCHDAGEDGC